MTHHLQFEYSCRFEDRTGVLSHFKTKLLKWNPICIAVGLKDQKTIVFVELSQLFRKDSVSKKFFTYSGEPAKFSKHIRNYFQYKKLFEGDEKNIVQFRQSSDLERHTSAGTRTNQNLDQLELLTTKNEELKKEISSLKEKLAKITIKKKNLTVEEICLSIKKIPKNGKGARDKKFIEEAMRESGWISSIGSQKN